MKKGLQLKKILSIGAVAAIHLAICRIVVTIAMNIDMMDQGSGQATVLFGKALVMATRVLYFPIITLSLYSRQWFPGNLIYIPIIANSLLWGIALFGLYSLRRRYRLNRTGQR